MRIITKTQGFENVLEIIAIYRKRWEIEMVQEAKERPPEPSLFD